MLLAGCSETESNFVNCRMCLVARGVKKESEHENTKSENSRDRYVKWY